MITELLNRLSLCSLSSSTSSLACHTLLKPFFFVPRIHTFLLCPALRPFLKYLRFLAPRLCPSELFSTSTSTLHFSTAIVSKLSHNANATQRSVELCPFESELFRYLAERSRSRLLQAHVLHHFRELDYRRDGETWRRLNSVCHRLGRAGGGWQQSRSVPGFRSPLKAQHEVKW